MQHSQQFVIVTDEKGNIFFHDFRDRLGAKKLVDSSQSPISCIIRNDFDVIFFDHDKNSRLIDFRKNQIMLAKKMNEIVRCGVTTKDPNYVLVGDTDVRLVNKQSLNVKLVHRIDKGPINAMARMGSQLFTGGHDCELKVI